MIDWRAVMRGAIIFLATMVLATWWATYELERVPKWQAEHGPTVALILFLAHLASLLFLINLVWKGSDQI